MRCCILDFPVKLGIAGPEGQVWVSSVHCVESTQCVSCCQSVSMSVAEGDVSSFPDNCSSKSVPESVLVLYLDASLEFLPEGNKQTVSSSYCKCNCNCGVHRTSAEDSCLPIQGTRYSILPVCWIWLNKWNIFIE